MCALHSPPAAATRCTCASTEHARCGPGPGTAARLGCWLCWRQARLQAAQLLTPNNKQPSPLSPRAIPDPLPGVLCGLQPGPVRAAGAQARRHPAPALRGRVGAVRGGQGGRSGGGWGAASTRDRLLGRLAYYVPGSCPTCDHRAHRAHPPNRLDLSYLCRNRWRRRCTSGSWLPSWLVT